MPNPIRGFTRGFLSFFRGCNWLSKHPGSVLLLLLPMLLGLTAVLSFWGFLAWQHEKIISWILPTAPEAIFWLMLFYLLKGLIYIVLLSTGLVFYVLATNIIAAPLYDYVSLQVERELSQNRSPELSLRQSILMIREEIKKFLFIVGINLIILFLPGINFLSPLVAAASLGWELYDYPLARRGLSFRQRLGIVSRRMPTLAGLGIWALIPGMQFIILPLGIAAGTILAIEDLESPVISNAYE